MVGVLFHVWQEDPLALCFASHHESATRSLQLQLQLVLLLHPEMNVPRNIFLVQEVLVLVLMSVFDDRD